MEVQFTVRIAYGVPRMYPVNPAAQTLARLVGSKTLSPGQLDLARELGLDVVLVADPAGAVLP